MRGISRPGVLLAGMAWIVSSTLLASAFDDGVPLLNWTAPPYWSEPVASTPGAKHVMAPSNPPLAFHALTPCRITDTRGPAGPYGAPSMTANTPRSFVVTGSAARSAPPD